MITPSEFRTRWRAWWPDSVPVGWRMAAHSDRWLRIHSLPGSKRYPEAAEDRRTLLARHNAVADAIVAGAPCVLLGYDDAGRYDLPADHPMRPWLPDAAPVMRLAPDDEDSEATSVFAGVVAWHPGLLDDPLLEVAEGRLRLALLNWETGAVYAPYDGGADLYWPTTLARDAARGRFASWLSPEPSGL